MAWCLLFCGLLGTAGPMGQVLRWEDRRGGGPTPSMLWERLDAGQLVTGEGQLGCRVTGAWQVSPAKL